MPSSTRVAPPDGGSGGSYKEELESDIARLQSELDAIRASVSSNESLVKKLSAETRELNRAVTQSNRAEKTKRDQANSLKAEQERLRKEMDEAEREKGTLRTEVARLEEQRDWLTGSLEGPAGGREALKRMMQDQKERRANGPEESRAGRRPSEGAGQQTPSLSDSIRASIRSLVVGEGGGGGEDRASSAPDGARTRRGEGRPGDRLSASAPPLRGQSRQPQPPPPPPPQQQQQQQPGLFGRNSTGSTEGPGLVGAGMRFFKSWNEDQENAEKGQQQLWGR